MLADTGYWLALANPADTLHDAAIAATQEISEPVLVTWPVVTETCHLLGRYGGADAQTRYLAVLRSGAEICPQGIDDIAQMGDLMAKCRDLPMDLADAPLVAAATAIGDGRILTTDERYLGVYRWSVNESFQNVLASFRRR